MSIRESQLTISRRLIANIKTVNESLSINRPGDPLKLTTVDPIARESADIRMMLDYLHKLQTIQGMKYIVQSPSYAERLRVAFGVNSTTGRIYTYREMKLYIENDITAMAKNYGVTRVENKHASTTVRFYYPDTSPRTVNIGTEIRTAGTSTITFTTNEQITNQTPIYDGVASGDYYIDIGAVCTESGSSGNVSAYRLTQCNGAAGHLRCTNRAAATGGFGRESMLSLISRIESRMKGYYIPTRAGYENFMLDNGCRQAQVIMPGDTNSVRAGGVDVYVVLYEESAKVQNMVSLAQGEVFLNYQPVQRVTGVTATTGGIPAVKVEGTDFRFVKDTTTQRSRTVYALDKVQWITTPPAAGDDIAISFVTNQKIKWLQDKLNLGGNYDTVGRVYIKEADRIFIDVGIEALIIKDGYAIENVKDSIRNALLEVFYGSNTYPGMLMNEDVYEEDLIAAISGAEGVDHFATPLVIFRRQEDAATCIRVTTTAYKIDVSYIIQMGIFEYASLGTIYYQ